MENEMIVSFSFFFFIFQTTLCLSDQWKMEKKEAKKAGKLALHFSPIGWRFLLFPLQRKETSSIFFNSVCFPLASLWCKKFSACRRVSLRAQHRKWP